MDYRQNRFQGEPGTFLRSGGSNNTGQNGDDPASIVSPNNNEASQYSDDITNMLTGGTVLKVSAPGGSTTYPFRWDDMQTSTGGGAVQIAGITFTSPLPEAVTSEFAQHRGVQQNIRMRLQEDRVYLHSNTGFPPLNLTTENLFGVPLCIDYVFAPHEDAAQRRVACRIRRMDDLSGTPLMELDEVGSSRGDAGSTPMVNHWLLGGPSAAPMPTYYVMGFTVETDRTTYLPDPELYEPTQTPPQALMTVNGQWEPHDFLITQDNQWWTTALPQ